MSGIRVRRHTDGRVAVKLADGPWQTVYGWMEERWPSQEEINDSGDWRELLVAELPEPDDRDWTLDGAKEPYWRTSRGKLWAFPDGVEREETGGLDRDVERLRSDALKMLAAVAACEQHRQETK